MLNGRFNVTKFIHSRIQEIKCRLFFNPPSGLQVSFIWQHCTTQKWQRK